MSDQTPEPDSIGMLPGERVTVGREPLMDADEFLAALGLACEGSGWTLVRQRVDPDAVQVKFVRNTSPYGEASSVHRQRQRIAVASEVLARQIVADQQAEPDPLALDPRIGFGGTRKETGPT